MVAITFANVAMDLIADGVRGRMVGDPRRPLRPHDAARSGRSDRARSTSTGCTTSSGFRPSYAGKLGEPLLLLGTPTPALA